MAIDLVDVANGTGGFVIHGEEAGDFSGRSVASAGDINGDGFDDLIIGAPGADGPGNTRVIAGGSYVVFGKAGGFPAAIDLAALANGTGGFVIHGKRAGEFSGYSVASAGDIDGDGFDDLIIGARGPPPDFAPAGGSYVVFGKAAGFGAAIDLVNVAAGSGGFVIRGEEAYDGAWHAASAGDINGDGFDDLIVGAYGADGPGNARAGAGDSYVVFGKASGFGAVIDLAAVAASTGGFVIHGEEAGDFSGTSVSSAGDVNGDGFDDLIIGADLADGPGNARAAAGDSYVVFGKASGFGAAIDLVDVAAGTGGFVIHGEETYDLSGLSVSSAGDVNGDGFDDLIIGAPSADGPGAAPGTRLQAGDSYVVFGKASGFGAAIDLVDVAAGTGGFVIHGEEAGDFSGRSVASAGDINGDGFDDLIVGASVADGPGNARNFAGDSYVVFGKASGFSAAIDLVDVAAGTGGFVIHGEETEDLSGNSVSSAGDIDGDGFDDLIIGAWGADGPANTRSDAGSSYVLFGSATVGGSADAVTHLGDATSQTLTGDGNANVMVGGRGDDILLGNGGADVLRGGEGDDTLTISDANFQRITGGTGNDMLAFSGGITFADTDFRGVEGIEGIKLANGVTNLTLGVIASHAIGGLAADSFRITIDASSVLNAAVTIDGSDLQRGLRANLSSNSAAMDLTGGAGADLFTGGSASDALNGGANNDVLNGGADADTLTGGAGNDSYFVDNAGDTIVETTGIDIVNVSVNYVLGADVAVETLRTVNAAATTALNLTGNNLANIVTGNAGNNVLGGGGGADTLQGLGGNDSYFVDSAADTIVDTAGIDNVNASVSYTLGAGIAVETLRTTNAAGTAAINLTGNNLANIVTGNAGANILDGRGAADTMQGLAGNDSYFVDHANDKVIEAINAGTDLVRSTASITLGANVENTILIGAAAINGVGNALANSLIGNSGANILNGHSGDDRLSGAAGNDFLVGGAGKDTMIGGASNDRFDFNSVDEIGNAATRDIISDFTHLTDTIDLSTIDANGAAAGNTAFSFLASHGAAFTGVAGQLRWFRSDVANNANDMTFVAGDVNGDSVADFQIQLTGLKTLTTADFIL